MTTRLRIGQCVALASFIALAWIAVLAGTLRVSGEAPAALVLLPGPSFLQNLPQDAAIIAQSDVSITLTSDQPEFITRLYASGAGLILPAGLQGCSG